MYLIGLATMHIFSFAECLNPLLSFEGISACFNQRLQSGGNIKDDFKAIVENGWSFSEITSSENTLNIERQGSEPALSSSRKLYLQLMKTEPSNEAYLDTLKAILLSRELDFIFKHMLEMNNLPNQVTAHVVYDRYSPHFFTVLDNLRKHFYGKDFKKTRIRARRAAAKKRLIPNLKLRRQVSSVQPTLKRKASNPTILLTIDQNKKRKREENRRMTLIL